MKVNKVDLNKFGARLKELREPFGSMAQFCTLFNKVTGSTLSPAQYHAGRRANGNRIYLRLYSSPISFAFPMIIY